MMKQNRFGREEQGDYQEGSLTSILTSFHRTHIVSLIPNAMSATETNSQEVPSPLANIPPVNAETPQVLKMIVHSAVDKLDSILSKHDIQLCSLNPMSKTKIHQEIPWIKYPTTVLAFRRITTRLF